MLIAEGFGWSLVKSTGYCGGMRVGLVHSFYGVRGGEDVAVDDEAEALARRGHEVLMVSEHTSTRRSRSAHSLRAGLVVATNRGPSPLAALQDFRPDVVHVHNLFPNYGRSWVTRWGGAIVHTVHNYRGTCANGLHFRDGCHCFDCLGRTLPTPAVSNSCYRGSRLATLPLAIGMARGLANDPLFSRANVVIFLNQHMLEHHVAAGLDIGRARLGVNFLPDSRRPDDLCHSANREGWLFVGRDSPEKGLDTLLDRWPPHHKLTVAGAAREFSKSGVSFRGRVSRAEVLELMACSVGLVFPSLCLESLPLVYVEALASGLPVFAFSSNSVSDLVKSDESGMVVEWDQDIGEALDRAMTTFAGLRKHVRAVFESRYSEESALSGLESLFRDAQGP